MTCKSQKQQRQEMLKHGAKILNASLSSWASAHSNLSIQYILNCGTEEAGSCHGGYHTSTYEFIKKVGYVPYDTCQPYIACSEESTEGESTMKRQVWNVNSPIGLGCI